MNASIGFDQFRGETEPALKSWLREILRNELAMASRHYLKAAKRDVRRETSSRTDSQYWQVRASFADHMPTPSSEAVLEEDAAELRAAMMRLSDDYRSILFMRNWERLTFRQIATRLERTENAAKKLWARALTRLEAELFAGKE